MLNDIFPIEKIEKMDKMCKTGKTNYHNFHTLHTLNCPCPLHCREAIRQLCTICNILRHFHINADITFTVRLVFQLERISSTV